MAGYRILPFAPELGLPTVRMWRRAFEIAMGLPLTNGPNTAYQDQLRYLESQYVDHELTHVLHSRSPRVLGFMAQQDDYISHLYLSPTVQRQGVGGRLLAQARQRSPQGLQLHCFQQNRGARAFYTAQGFEALAYGQAELADNPWAAHPAQLDDVMLRWRPG